MRVFFKYPKYFGRLGKSDEYVVRYFGVFWVVLSAQILSLYFLSVILHYERSVNFEMSFCALNSSKNELKQFDLRCP
jgi:hypothetical protein